MEQALGRDAECSVLGPPLVKPWDEECTPAEVSVTDEVHTLMLI